VGDRSWFVVTSVALAMACLSSPAQAAFPGANGKLAFSTTDSPSGGVTAIRTVNPDGTGGQNIAPATGPFGSCYDELHSAVDWSPDGRRVAFNYFYAIRIAAANGTTERDIEMFVAKDFAWSPDGQRIAFVRWATQSCNDPNQTDSEADEVWIVNADGTGLTQVTTTGTCAFSDICTEIHTLSW
jgi:Tol biopolymer transport system component